MSDKPTIEQAQSPALWSGALEEAGSLIGVALRRGSQQWNTEAAPDSVRQFCWGIGDENPLFCDPGYGEQSSWRSALAPGCFLYTIDSTVVAPKLRGIQWLYGGTDWEWYKPIRHRDQFKVSAKLISAEEKKGSKAKKFIIQTGEILYDNQHGELVCRALGRTARTPRSKAKDGLKYAPRETHQYSNEELVHMANLIHNEQVQGKSPRYFEEVEVGTSLAPILKGPLNITDMICWYSGGGHSYQAHRRAAMYRKKHPADAFRDKKTGAEDSPARGHTEQKMARDVGMPGGYDVGPQRISWLGQLLTNWIGDDGFLRRLNVSLRRPNIFGDVSWCKAKIVDKRIDDGDGLIELEVFVENQLGEITAEGSAIVELPQRNAS